MGGLLLRGTFNIMSPSFPPPCLKNLVRIFLFPMLIVADSKIPHASQAFSQFGEVKIVPTQQITREIMKDADAILVRSETRVNAVLLERTNIRFVGTATIGTDHLDTEYLQKQEIGWASCPGSNANSVGEYVLAVLLELSARFGISLQNKSLGIVGHGNTGRKVEEKATAMGMHVLLNDPPLAQDTAGNYLPIDALMEADFISLHVPLSTSGVHRTVHLFDKQRLGSMKGILVNASRGAVVETGALKDVLRSGRIRTCALDVWEDEPDIDIGLLQLAAIGTPHIAGYSYEGKLKATEMLQKALAKFFQMPYSQTVLGEIDELQEIPLPEMPLPLEALVRGAVQHCYSVGEDDMNLRRLVSYAQHERPAYFRKLRAEYRVRREFSRYVVDVSDCDELTRNTFATLGFRINDLKDAA